jgi:hypothetical protein
MLESARNSFYFDKNSFTRKFSLKTRRESGDKRGKDERPSKSYVDSTDIVHLVMTYTGNASQVDRGSEINARKCFLDLCMYC